MDLPPINEKVIYQIKKFIKDKVEEASVDGVVLGLSGGIDSTVTAYLCKEALGPDRVLGIVMPARTTSLIDVKHARMVAEILGIENETIQIDPLIEPFKSLCYHKSTKLARGNLKARMRMMILYYHSNSLNRLVVGTGNRTELLVGYFTKYGDGGVDILPIGCLYKSHVKLLAEKLKVPVEIIEKTPTAGLWYGQTDEEELGIKYPILDRILYLMVDQGLDDQNISERVKAPIGEVKRIRMMVKNSRHKINPPEVPNIKF
ncbi:NAD+ synthase [Methanothermobacter tenebrarum]|uniref:NH(3)-dependent NAD(+) synthetase n=1 Tax=Methanothermobacter tenebrarum TaxID=680118 RepID=A0A328PCM9_9EURY|nr:NAD+ synthase [Methanothermobacter tenebrarum]NPV65342.1 NAD+ synthase [Methanobacteriaceae archaeon]RAO78951.1 NAD(+) synthetase [Methanothermobacter tenebrarum]